MADTPVRVKCPYCNGEGHRFTRHGDGFSGTAFCMVCSGTGWTIAEKIRAVEIATETEATAPDG